MEIIIGKVKPTEEQISTAINMLIENGYRITKVIRKAKAHSVKQSDIEEEWIAAIIKDVCECVYLDTEDIYKKTRKREIVEARQMAQCIAHKLTDTVHITLARIAELIGEQDHATVLHSSKTVDNLIETDATYRAKFDAIIENYGLWS